jgi:hypothetical protein
MTTTTRFSLLYEDAERTTRQIFISPIFISFMPLRAALAVVQRYLFFSSLLRRLGKDSQSSDCLVFRKRFQEILIGILCICFEATSRGKKKGERESEIV